MELKDRAAYHGPNFRQRRSPMKVFYKRPYQLHKAVLFLQHPKLQVFYNKADPDKLLHLDTLNLQTLKEEMLAFKHVLEAQGVEVYVKEFETFLPNIIYASDTFFSFKGDVYLARMASDIRRMAEPFVYRFFHDLRMNPKDIFDRGDILEASSLLYLPDRGFFIGKGKRGNKRAIETIKNHFTESIHVIKLPNDVQHLMGVVRVVSKDVVIIRHQKLSEEALSTFAEEFEDVLKVPESREVTKKQALNFVAYEQMKIIMPDDCPSMQKFYEEHGIKVKTVKIGEIRKGGGGLACLTGRLK